MTEPDVNGSSFQSVYAAITASTFASFVSGTVAAPPVLKSDCKTPFIHQPQTWHSSSRYPVRENCGCQNPVLKPEDVIVFCGIA